MGSQATVTTTSISMRFTPSLFLLLSALTLSSASPRFLKLETPMSQLGCSIDEILACVGEIEQAVNDCGHLTTQEEIMTCINDILGTTNCQKCICDVVPVLCGQ